MNRNECRVAIRAPLSHWKQTSNDCENSRARTIPLSRWVGVGYREYNSYISYNYYIPKTYGQNPENWPPISRASQPASRADARAPEWSQA